MCSSDTAIPGIAGYLRTIPTASLLKHFALKSPLLGEGKRLGAVFGVDNLAGRGAIHRSIKMVAMLILPVRETALFIAIVGIQLSKNDHKHHMAGVFG